MREENKNSGFSLIELVVVLAIMGAVVLFSFSMYDSVSSAEVDSVAENIDSMLSKLRTESLTKASKFKLKVIQTSTGEFEVGIYKGEKHVDAAGAAYYTWTEKIASEELGKKVEIQCITSNHFSLKLTTDCYFMAQCSKSDGAYQYLTCETNSGSIVSKMEMLGEVTELKITKGKTASTIKLVKTTGRHHVE